ncbi:Fic family protein [Dyadobacter sp. CY327]|uniref:Fic family protein n=1 Tax=Dyadobacter sp. CY327 TaxID=2907301 RepID=UPI001F464F23|nr:Fic family protein [Dyadobacter sp. CY327]MCE7069002.1 Fic family protein [Dyadobacter sp. CY327]
MELISSETFSALNDLDIIKDIDILREKIDALRPLAKDIEGRIMQKLRLEWNYNSNAIEGNSLDYGETVALLMHGVTAKGKPLKDYFDIEGHNQVIDYLTHFVQHGEDLTEKEIRGMHEMMLVRPYENLSKTEDGRTVQRKIHLGEYKRMPNHVETRTGEIHYYATPEETPILMHDLVSWYRNVTSTSELHPVVIASIFHHRFTAIHPFDDGNGRMSRLLMNLILMRHGYPPAVVKNNEKDEYFAALSQADIGNYEPFVDYIGAALVSSMNVYVKGANGENLDDPSDLRKKIVLFKKEVEARRDKIETKRSLEVQQKVYKESVLPFLNELLTSLSDFKDLFISYSENIKTFDHKGNEWIYMSVNVLQEIERLFNKDEHNESIEIYQLRFSDFKVAENPFSIDLLIIISLQDYRYRIGYSILEGSILQSVNRIPLGQWGNKSSTIDKYYHQNINKDEVASFVSEVGSNLLDCIKDIFSERPILIPSIEDIQRKWEYIVESSTKLPRALKLSLTSVNSYNINIVGFKIEIAFGLLLYQSIPQGARIDLETRLHKILYNKNYTLKDDRIYIISTSEF